MRSVDLPVVAQLPLFEGLATVQIDALIQAAYLQRFPPQVQLVSEGEHPDFLHVVVVEGCVELYARTSRRETTVDLVRPVATFILAAVLNDAVYLMSARTIEKSRVLMIPAEAVRRLMHESPVFAGSVVRELAVRYRTVVKKLKDQKLRTAVERLANLILRLHVEQGRGSQVRLPCEKRVIASLLGMTPENLSRAFSALAPHGVRVDGAEVEITDIERLRRFAQPVLLIDDEQI